MLMYKQRPYLNWRAKQIEAQTLKPLQGHIHPKGRGRGWWDETKNSPLPLLPSCTWRHDHHVSLLTWLYNTAYDWWWVSLTPAAKKATVDSLWCDLDRVQDAQQQSYFSWLILRFTVFIFWFQAEGDFTQGWTCEVSHKWTIRLK